MFSVRVFGCPGVRAFDVRCSVFGCSLFAVQRSAFGVFSVQLSVLIIIAVCRSNVTNCLQTGHAYCVLLFIVFLYSGLHHVGRYVICIPRVNIGYY